jgi:hypothetical protein
MAFDTVALADTQPICETVLMTGLDERRFRIRCGW